MYLLHLHAIYRLLIQIVHIYLKKIAQLAIQYTKTKFLPQHVIAVQLILKKKKNLYLIFS